jgi:hypothetical protein
MRNCSARDVPQFAAHLSNLAIIVQVLKSEQNQVTLNQSYDDAAGLRDAREPEFNFTDSAATSPTAFHSGIGMSL